MARLLLLIISFLALNTSLYAQKRGQERIDSLLTELPKTKEDTNKVNILYGISMKYKSINVEEGIKYGEQCLALAKQLGWEKGEANGLYVLCLNNMEKGDYHKSMAFGEGALAKYAQLDITIGETNTLAAIGNCYM